MGVDVRTYNLWEALGQHPDLPDAAIPAVVEALTTRGTSHLGIDKDDWRSRALKRALPHLLTRTSDHPAQRAALIRAATRQEIVDAVQAGTLGVDDVPSISAHHEVWPDLVVALAHHPEHLPAVLQLLPGLDSSDLESVVARWERPHAERNGPGVPPAVLSTVLDLVLRPLTGRLRDPDADPHWVASATMYSPDWSRQLGDGPAWRVLARCQEDWPRLVGHLEHGRAVQHLLLDNADPEALNDVLLAACLPALTCPELAHLPKPMATQRLRLRHVAHRVRRHPRLQQLAAEELNAAADECVARGRLLHTNARRADGDITRIACDLAALSSNVKHLTKACAHLARCEQPTVVAKPTKLPFLAGKEEAPGFLLRMAGSTARVETLCDLAGNPHTPRQALLDVLDALHPAEASWLTDPEEAVPDWLRQHVQQRVPDSLGDGVLRILTDDELDEHPDPAIVLQSWLDAPRNEDSFDYDTVTQAILGSRHCTEAHLRQLPARSVLTYDVLNTATPVLLNRCGNDPSRWAELLAALHWLDDTATSTFGEFLDTTLPSGSHGTWRPSTAAADQ